MGQANDADVLAYFAKIQDNEDYVTRQGVYLIGKKVEAHVDETTVRRVKADLPTAAKPQLPTKTTGKDGKAREA